MAVLATDNFDRANSSDLGASWDVMTGESHFDILSNQVKPTGIGGADVTESYNAVTWPNDQYSQVVAIVVLDTGSATTGIGIGPAVRCATGARTYYRCCVIGSTANGTEISKIVAGSYTALANQTAAWVANDIVYLSAVGTTLQVKRNGTNLFSATDSAITSGRAGISYSSQTSTVPLIDNWEGGGFAGASLVFSISQNQHLMVR